MAAVAMPSRSRANPKKPRLCAEQRRRDVVEAAIVEFAENSYHGTRTADTCP
jgi:AcrR family transcriptional regulator